MVGTNATGVYGFELEQLVPLAAEIGPECAQVAAGNDVVPETLSLAFEARSAGVS